MYFKRIYSEDLSQASYLLACSKHKHALIVDPRRDVQVYLDELQQQGFTLKGVLETHIHADFVSGARELQHHTGATLHLPASAKTPYGFPHQPLQDTSRITLGDLTVIALHTPGHTEEHLSFLVLDDSRTQEPVLLLSGDFVFVEDLGRPDIQEAGQDHTLEHARQMFQSLVKHFVTLPEWVQVWPGHGAGSTCGKNLGQLPSSTVGYETRFSWWSAHLKACDEKGFTRTLLDGQPELPSYFHRVKRLNREGPPLLGEVQPLEEVSFQKALQQMEQGVKLIDTRSRTLTEQGTVPGSLFLPAGRTFSAWGAWVLKPEDSHLLMCEDPEEAQHLREKLWRIGVDRTVGWVGSWPDRLPADPSLSWHEAKDQENLFVLDIRSQDEREGGTIPGSHHLPAGQVMARLSEMPRDRPVLVHCQKGNRSKVITRFLQSEGFENVFDLKDGFEGYLQDGVELP